MELMRPPWSCEPPIRATFSPHHWLHSTHTHPLCGFISYQNVVFYRILLSTFTTRDRWYFKVRVTWWLNEWHLEYVFPFFSIFTEKTSPCLSSKKKKEKKENLIWEMNGYTCQAGILYTHTSSFHIITLQLPEHYSYSHSPWDRADHTAHTPHVSSTHTWCTFMEPAAFTHLEPRHRSITHN